MSLASPGARDYHDVTFAIDWAAEPAYRKDEGNRIWRILDYSDILSASFAFIEKFGDWIIGCTSHQFGTWRRLC